MSRAIKIYDTTLRDGAQFKGISFSLSDKLQITKLLDQFGMDYIEGGWPGSNPKDEAYFQEIKELNLQHAKIVAFGATRKPNSDVNKDRQIMALLAANTQVIALVAKFWDFQVQKVLNTDLNENLSMIYDSVKYFKQHQREVVVDAEHFFDGFKENPEYSLQCLQTAINAGTDNVTLCDTNGGTMPEEIFSITKIICQKFPDLSVGIHCHNDCELAVANSLSAIKAGANLIQGTINGYGERCGNANLISIIANLQLKKPYKNLQLHNDFPLEQLSQLAQQISNIANISLNPSAAYVGTNAFSHKGGIHVAAIAKASKSYEHIPPHKVGNQRDIIVSELSGKANVLLQAEKLGLHNKCNITDVLQQIKSLEQTGLTLENASGSLEMLIRRMDKNYHAFFEILSISINTCDFNDDKKLCTATVKLSVQNQTSLVVAESKGPVDALNLALKKALLEYYPEVNELRLNDYKVSIIDPENASAATTRVWLQAAAHDQTWATIGRSQNIIDASTQALIDSYQLFLTKFHKNPLPIFNKKRTHSKEERQYGNH